MIDHLKNNATKWLGGLISALGVAAMNLTPEQIVAILGAKGPGAVVAITGILTYLRGLQNSGQLPGGPTGTQPKTHPLSLMFAAVIAVLMMVSMTACATFTPTQQLAATVGIQYATAKYIEHEPEAKRDARAVKVINTAVALKAVAENATATVDTLQGEAYALIDRANLSTADKILANSIVAAVVEELRKRISTGVLKEDDKLVVVKVLDNIIAAANGYVQNPVET